MDELKTEQYQPNDQFVTVTELAGDGVTEEQVERLCSKYYWAETYCRGKDVVEVACGTGPGLGYLARTAKSVIGGDISDAILTRARQHYGTRLPILKLDAESLPFEAASKDVILIFEALYYLPNPRKFLEECLRVLRSEGMILIVTANKDIYAFNPSPFSHVYFGVVELERLLADFGFIAHLFGNSPIAKVSLRQKVLQPVKKFAVRMNLMPKTMAGKKLFKRLVFGSLIPMPAEVEPEMVEVAPPQPLPTGTADRQHKVIFCEARRRPSQ